MHVQRQFTCEDCDIDFVCNQGRREKPCPECNDIIDADPDYWNITREFYCDNCDEEFESTKYNKETMKCRCGQILKWEKPFGRIQRFYYCRGCRKNFESLNFRQDEIECPYTHCEEVLHENKKKTIYHGKLFGRYRCAKEKCGKTWSSAYAFDGEWQECKSCNTKTEPHYLIEHERNGKQGDKEHRSDLCGRCKSGRPCRGARFQASYSSEEESTDEESVTDLMYGMSLNHESDYEHYNDYYYDDY